jgi:Rhodopirellula transposase DDE domain
MEEDIMAELSESVKEDLLLAAGKLTGYRRREYQAEMAIKYCEGSPRRAKRVFGWGREAVRTGLHERRSGIRCLDNFGARGRRTTEETHPEWVARIHALVEPESQADPKFQTPLAYTRITAKAVHQHLAAAVAGTDQPVPAERTVSDMLNRLGYRLRRVRKTVPKKKFPKPMPSSSTSAKSTPKRGMTRKHSASRSTPRPR